ncbi:hypothetical protein RUND412_006738 [Rhizina undulata]
MARSGPAVALGPPPRVNLALSYLPRDIVIYILSYLPYTSLLACQRLSKRFNTLIKLAPELRANIFRQSPVLSDDDFTSPVALHPVFSHLHFFAYHSAKAVRIGEGLDGKYLSRAKVKEDFATSPALKELFLRVIGGEGCKFDEEIAIRNQNGITVWDVITRISEFFSTETDITLGEHFGLQECEARGWDDTALVINHEFLNPELPFPTIWFRCPGPVWNRQFFIDYSFSAFASQPLLVRPSSPLESPESAGSENFSDRKLPCLSATVQGGSSEPEERESLANYAGDFNNGSGANNIKPNPATNSGIAAEYSGKEITQQEAIILAGHDYFTTPPEHITVVNKWHTWAAQEAGGNH